MSRDLHRSAAYCLHSRPYRETSAIVQLFTRDAGRVAAIAKGVKSANRQRRHVLAGLQPFTPVQVAWLGSGDLKTLASIELEGVAWALEGRALFAGLYLNELLNTLLLEQQEHGELYRAYEATLEHLAEDPANMEPVLRRFERFLLEQLGYGIAFEAVDEQGAQSGALLVANRYRYATESGFIAVVATDTRNQNDIFSGEHLCRIAMNELDTPEVLYAAKLLMRQALSSVLGNKLLNSRHLFV